MFTKEDLKIATIASKDSTRPIICAVNIVNKQNGSVTMAATDGYVLTEKTIKVSETPGFDNLLIPAKSLINVAKLMGRHDLLTITNDSYIITDMKQGTARTLSIDKLDHGEFPDYIKLLPTKAEARQTISLNSKLLAEILAVVDGSDGNTEFKLQVAIDEKGMVEQLAPVRIDSENDHVTTVSVIMPLKPKR